MFLLRLLLLSLTGLQLLLQELDNIQVGRSNVRVVFLDLSILFLMLERTLLNLGILTELDHVDALLSALFHLSSQVNHPFLIFELDLVT